MGSLFLLYGEKEEMPFNNNGPCLGCTKRYVGCHGSCDGYLSWKKSHDEFQEAIRKNKIPMIAHAQYVRTRYRKEQ